MNAATISRVLGIGLILSLMVLLVAGPVSGQGTSGAPAAPGDQSGTDQVPPFLGPQAPSSPDSGTDPVMGAIMAPVAPVPTAPAQLPATGGQQNPYLELMDQYRQMYGGSPAPSQLPQTGAAAGTTLQELLPEEIVGATADSPEQSLQPLVLGAPEELPATGAPAATTDTAALQELVPEEVVGVTADAPAASPAPAPAPAQLPQTGGGTPSVSPAAPSQQQNPYLELLGQYRQMYGGH